MYFSDMSDKTVVGWEAFVADFTVEDLEVNFILGYTTGRSEYFHFETGFPKKYFSIFIIQQYKANFFKYSIHNLKKIEKKNYLLRRGGG